jgi:hypothetical protein
MLLQLRVRVVLDVTRATEAAKAGKDDEAMQLLESADAYIKEFVRINCVCSYTIKIMNNFTLGRDDRTSIHYYLW